MTDSDVLSLTLPKPGSKTRVKLRKPKLPPNWKSIVFYICIDIALMIANLLYGTVFGALVAVMFGLDISIQIKRLFREDGGYRFKGEDRIHGYLIAFLWSFLMVHYLFGVF